MNQSMLKFAKIPTIFIFISLFISACGTGGIADYQTLGLSKVTVREPTAWNNYSGFLLDQNSSSQDALNARATEICMRFGGIKEYPKLNGTKLILDWIFYEYQCKGFPPSVTATKEVSLPLNQEPEKLFNDLNLEDARKKCQELGFETGTETFGKCVLKLSK